MSNVNVTLFSEGILAPGAMAQWFEDIPPRDYNAALRRVRTFSVVPYVFVEDPPSDPSRPLPLPPDPPYPPYEQRIAVTQVFHLLKATPPVPPGTTPPNAPQLQINFVIRNLSNEFPVQYRVYMSETDN
jgi:hypothetical protein